MGRNQSQRTPKKGRGKYSKTLRKRKTTKGDIRQAGGGPCPKGGRDRKQNWEKLSTGKINGGPKRNGPNSGSRSQIQRGGELGRHVRGSSGKKMEN